MESKPVIPSSYPIEKPIISVSYKGIPVSRVYKGTFFSFRSCSKSVSGVKTLSHRTLSFAFSPL